MTNLKIEIIKPKQNKKQINIINTIITLLLGILLLFNNNELIVYACKIFGILLFIDGIYMIIKYRTLNAGIYQIIIGVLVFFLANFIETSIRILVGIIMLIIGLNKLLFTLNYQAKNYLGFTYALILIASAIYCIFFQNIILSVIGVILIVSSILNIIEYFKTR